jgi:hypothetical protein
VRFLKKAQVSALPGVCDSGHLARPGRKRFYTVCIKDGVFWSRLSRPNRPC